ncbi:MAG: hypothetical protein QM564_01715 [Bergeyella sp.]
MKKFLVLSFISAGVISYAQTIGNSPYAAFGIGDVKFDNTADTNAMGGITTAYISDFNNSFNFRNPAANTNLELTSVKFEVTNENNFFKSDYNNINTTKNSNYISNISIAFPISKKVKFGMGYQPYSSKKYSIMVTEQADEDQPVKANYFHGEGTLNTVQAAVSYQIFPEFALGLRSNFIFGNLYDIDELTSSNSELINGYETRNKVKTFNFTAGTTYQKKFGTDRKLTLGATYSFGNTGNMETFYTNSTYYYNVSGEKQQQSIIDEDKSTDKQLVPLETSFGAGYGRDLKWFVGSQLDLKKGETIQFLGQPFSYENSYKISAGGWFIPNINNFRSYFSRVIYRYGAYYEKGNLNLNGKDINRFAVTGGATFPFQNRSAGRLTGIDFGVEVGKRGTLENNLVNQTFVNFRIGINFADKWFQKALYD